MPLSAHFRMRRARLFSMKADGKSFFCFSWPGAERDVNGTAFSVRQFSAFPKNSAL